MHACIIIVTDLLPFAGQSPTPRPNASKPAKGRAKQGSISQAQTPSPPPPARPASPGKASLGTAQATAGASLGQSIAGKQPSSPSPMPLDKKEEFDGSCPGPVIRSCFCGIGSYTTMCNAIKTSWNVCMDKHICNHGTKMTKYTFSVCGSLAYRLMFTVTVSLLFLSFFIMSCLLPNYFWSQPGSQDSARSPMYE